MKLLILPGDGIGPEISQANETVLSSLNNKFSLSIDIEYADIGFASLKKVGSTFPNTVIEKAQKKAVLIHQEVFG
jgi:3-isopropylmalate dehydrogenase